MAKVKIAVIGAGSYVFGSSMLSQAILDHRLDDIELALMDVDAEVLELMAGVGRRMARETGVRALITTHTSRDTALDGADFVTCSAARQMFRRYEMDCEIAERMAPGHVPSEFGGIAGISYSLRQIALIQEIAADIRRLCPKAWLLDAANPLPRVTQAAHEEGVRTAGFCTVSIAGYGILWRLLIGEPLSYPFTAAIERWDAVMAGLNHFSWIVELRDRATGADLLPEARAKLAAGATTGNPLIEAVARETGYLLASGDDHVKDFLPPRGLAQHRSSAGHGNPAERQQRLDYLRAIGEGRESWDELLSHGAWERPIDMIAALAFDRPARFHSLNLLNAGQIPALPDNVFVETPAEVTAAGPKPRKVDLPPNILPYCCQTAAVTDAIVRAARERKRSLVYEAVELDPTITDKTAGRAALDECLRAHADVLPKYD